MAQRLGDILLAQGAVDGEQLASALSDQRAFGGKLGRTLVDLGYVSEDQLVKALAQQLGLETVDLDAHKPTSETLSSITVDACERFGVFPVRVDGQERVLWLATAEPDRDTLQEVAQVTQLTLEPVLAPMSAIERAVRRHYYGDSGGPRKVRKGEPLLAIPMDDGAPKKKEKPVARLPSSAGVMVMDEHHAAAKEAPPAPPPPPVVEAAPPPPPAPPQPEPQPAPQANWPEPAPQPPPTAEEAVLEAEEIPIEEIAAASPDAVQDLARLVLRLEKIVQAQGRIFKSLVEVLQEKGLIRRGELGGRPKK